MCTHATDADRDVATPESGRLTRRALLGGGTATVGLALVGCGIGPFDRDPVNTVPVAEPPILGTAEWGAREPRRAASVIRHRPELIVVHHTTDPNTANVDRAHAITIAKKTQNYHMDSNGWSDTGQHFTVSRGGFALEGRTTSLANSRNGKRFTLGAHAAGANERSVGIENEGSYFTARMPTAQWNSLVALTSWLCTQHRIGVEGIVGHRDVTATTCPGDWLYGQLPRLRREVQAVLTGG